MVSPPLRVSFRYVFLLLLLFVAFYVGRPLYWKISATIHEIHEKRQTVQQGISQLVSEAQKSVGWGWYHDEFDSGYPEDQTRDKATASKTTTRRLLRAGC